MTTSIGQKTLVFLPGEPLSLTEKPGRPQSTVLQRVRHDRSDPVHIDAIIFFACCGSAPARVEHEAAWLARIRVAPSVQGHGLPLQKLWSYQSLFFFSRDSCSWQLEGLFGHSFSVALNFQALRGLPFLGSSSVVPCIRHIDGTPYWGPTL